MHGTITGPLPDNERDMLSGLNKTFNMREHERNTGLLTNELIDRFAIVGPPDICTRRLEAIAALGIEKVIVTGPWGDQDDDAVQHAEDMFARQVLPSFSRPMSAKGSPDGKSTWC